MKTVYLIRHAKSDWGVDSLADIDRPLNTRGYNDAHLMSLRIKDKKIIPDAIITSPAIRAISTALIFARNLDFNVSNIKINASLYNSDTKKYLDVISHTDNKINSFMLFGHNPIITDCANSLIKNHIETFPTCAIMGIRGNCEDWKAFINANNELILFDFPKNIL